MTYVKWLATTLIAMTFAMSAHSAPTPSPDGALAYIIYPVDGETVKSPVTVQFGLVGMGVAPAGVEQKNTGHHHLLVDVDTPPAAGKPIPADKHHIHFGGGQTQTALELAPGTHTLQLELGDANHIPFSPRVQSQKITITVE